jgi:hypothetical protein
MITREASFKTCERVLVSATSSKVVTSTSANGQVIAGMAMASSFTRMVSGMKALGPMIAGKESKTVSWTARTISATWAASREIKSMASE